MSLVTPVSQPEAFQIRQALEKIRTTGDLPPSHLQLLTYLVEKTLSGEARTLNQKTVAADVFDRDLARFDPHKDSMVRTTASKLRDRLMAYYSGRGQNDPVMIELPAGSYVPVFSLREQLSAGSISRLWSARLAMEARTVSGYRTGIRNLDSVLAESPDFSLALALKAEALASQAIHGARPRPLLEEARVCALRAVSQPRVVWQAWLAQGIVQQALEWNWDAAGESYRKALELSGNEAAHHVWYTAFLVGRGRPREAISHLSACVERYGYTNPTCIGDLCMLLMLSRQYEDAAVAIDSAIEAAPDYYQHHMNRAILFEAQGDPRGALGILDRTPLRLHERPVTWGLRALFAGLSGSPQVARRRLSWFEMAAKAGKYIPPSQFAACWLGMGEPDRAIACLESAAEDRDPLAVWFHAYPFFRHLHGRRAFGELIGRVGLVRYLAAGR